MVENIEERKDCPMRDENGNCMVIGDFCVDDGSDEICHGLHNAYDAWLRELRRVIVSEFGGGQKKIHYQKPCWIK